jgi:hypothetical protein
MGYMSLLVQSYTYNNETIPIDLGQVPELSNPSIVILQHLNQKVPLELHTPLKERVASLEEVAKQLKETQNKSIQNKLLALLVGTLGVAAVASTVVFGFWYDGLRGLLIATVIVVMQGESYMRGLGKGENCNYDYPLSYLGSGLILWCVEILMKESSLVARYREENAVIQKNLTEQHRENNRKFSDLINFYAGNDATLLIRALEKYIERLKELLNGESKALVPSPTRIAEISDQVERCQQTITEVQALQKFYTAFIVKAQDTGN